MTTQPDPQPGSSPPRRPTGLYYVGMPMMILGIVTTTIFSVRQYKESGTGSTYNEFIIPGVVLAIVGFVLLVLGRRGTPRA